MSILLLDKVGLTKNFAAAHLPSIDLCDLRIFAKKYNNKIQKCKQQDCKHQVCCCPLVQLRPWSWLLENICKGQIISNCNFPPPPPSPNSLPHWQIGFLTKNGSWLFINQSKKFQRIKQPKFWCCHSRQCYALDSIKDYWKGNFLFPFLNKDKTPTSVWNIPTRYPSFTVEPYAVTSVNWRKILSTQRQK